MTTQPNPEGVLETPIVPEVPVAVVADPPAIVPGEDIEKVDGLYQLVVGNKTYRAKTIRALLAETAKAIENGDQRIKDLNTKLKFKNGFEVPDVASDLEVTPVSPITADEAFQLTADLNKPESITKAVKRIVEAEMGRPLESFKSQSETEYLAEFKRRAFSAGKEFVLAHPEFIASKKNEEIVFKWMEENNVQPISLKNYEIAYSYLKDILDIKEVVTAKETIVPTPPVVPPPAAPAAAEIPAGTPVAAPRARLATTGASSRNASTPTDAAATKTGYAGFPTREQIDGFSAEEFAKWMQKPKFQEHYEIVYAKK